jgi:hypothetical protein
MYCFEERECRKEEEIHDGNAIQGIIASRVGAERGKQT